MPEPLAVLVPTRNRPELARRAIGSVAGASSRVQVFVSDNSSAVECREDLAGWLRAHHPEVTLFQTGGEMPMSAHWDWATKKVMATTAASHIAILTDRMRFRRYGLPIVQAALEAAPDRIVNYRFDTIDDWNDDVVRVELMRRTRRAYLLDTARVLERVAEWHGWEIPTPLNAAFPVGVFEQMASSRADGRIFGSLSPDYYVGFKALATVPDFVVCDDGVLVQFGLRQSNGYAHGSGVENEHSRDFARLEGGGFVFDSPYPTIMTAYNSIVHEYNVVRNEVGPAAMPEMQRAVVRRVLAWEARHMRSAARQREVNDVLEADDAVVPDSTGRVHALVLRLRHFLTLLRRHPLENLRIAGEQLGVTRVLCDPRTPGWGWFVRWAIEHRPSQSLARATRWLPVPFPTLDEAITAVEDVVPATAGAQPPPGVINELRLAPTPS